MKQIRIGSVWTAFAMLLGCVLAAPASAQQTGERYMILVPNLAPQNGANDNFGEDVAEELRDLIENLHTHQTVTDNEIDDARKKYDLDREQLYNCVTARQLAMREGWQLVLCGQYEEVGNRQVSVAANFVGAESGGAFEVPPFTASERDPEQAAQRILQSFDRWQTQLRHTVFCQNYVDSQQWADALSQCDQALEINPASESALYLKAYAQYETDEQEAALTTLDRLLELDPIRQDALKLAGIVATELEDRERASAYFDRYMELNPGDVQVRLTVATEIANAGDPVIALRVAEQGLEIEPDNMTLITYIGHFAANAAARAESNLASGEGAALDPAEVTEFYQTAADAYEQVFDAEGTETDPQILEKLIISKFKLGAFEEAISLGQRATQAQPENAAIWTAYSRALQEAGQTQEALAAIERVESLGGGDASLTQRKAMLQLAEGGADAAVAALTQAVEQGQIQAGDAFTIIFRHAYQEQFQKGQLDAALALLEEAGPLAVREEDQLSRNFWRGYIIFQQAQRVGEPMNAEAARRAKPMFERALDLFEAARGYEKIHASADVPALIENAQRFIEIQEALIKRGR